MPELVFIHNRRGRLIRVERREIEATWVPIIETKKYVDYVLNLKRFNPITIIGRPLADAIAFDAITNAELLTPEDKVRYLQMVHDHPLTGGFDSEFEDTPTVLGPPHDDGGTSGDRPTYRTFTFFIDP